MHHFMEDFRKWAHLVEQLGEQRVNVLIDSGNTGEVTALCDKFIADAIPTQMIIGGRTYEILSFLRGDEKPVKGSTMVARAKEANAHLGKEDGRNLLDNWQDIPAAFDNISFVFTDWPRPDYPEDIAIVCRSDDRWIRDWGWLGGAWDGRYRGLRRKSA